LLISEIFLGNGLVLVLFPPVMEKKFQKMFYKIVNLKNVSVWFLTRLRFLCGTHVRAILPPVANDIWHHVGRPGTVPVGAGTVKRGKRSFG
jgi:hypothetical protein